MASGHTPELLEHPAEFWQACLMKFLILATLTFAAPLAAQTPVSPEEFDAMTLGKTFTYGTSDAPYGAEEYLENRRVRWSFLDGRCVEGEWFVDRDLICFIYEEDPQTHCWSFFLEGDGLAARFDGDPSSVPLYEVARSEEPLYCMGPDVGA